MELRGAVGILTGASRGIGAVLAERLAREGVDLALAARSGEGLEATARRVRSHGARALPVPTDVTDPKALENLVEATLGELGPPNLLVNNAAVERYGHFERKDLDDIEMTIATNLTSVQMLTRLVLPHMIQKRRGHVVNVASVAGKSAVPYNIVYSSTKHAVVGFSWGLREEMRRHGIGVSVICPGFVSETGMYADHRPRDRAPSIAAEVRVEQVADAVVRSIQRDLAEVVVARGLAGAADVFHALSPSFAMGVARRSGAYAFLEEIAAIDEGNQ